MSKTPPVKTDTDIDGAQLESEIPIAVVEPGKLTFRDLLHGSHMWFVTLACLVVAIGVVWWSLPERGINISIHFPEGHGLTADDVVRFRGIDVGVVEEVKLNRDLDGVDVSVNLLPFAEPLAREGTRFWVVRPELSLGSISGLETAVGHKYIGLIPGELGAKRKTVFEGLSSSPPDATENRGVEIVVRGQQRYSVTAGSPVSCRGVIVGRVLSVDLSPDGLKVDVRVKIFEKFTKLVSSKTKFWASGGVDVDFSLSGGFKLDMESVETLVQGGVSFLTIEAGGKPIKPGDDFELHSRPEEEWLAQAATVQATNVRLRGALPLEMVWQHDGFLGNPEKQSSFVGTHLNATNQIRLLIPSDMMLLPKKGIEDTLKIGVVGLPKTQQELVDQTPDETALTTIELPRPNGIVIPKPLQSQEMRIPTQAESCLAVRANGDLSNLKYHHYAIDRHDIGDDWSLRNFNGDRSVWHGAPVFSEQDGKLIGVLLVGERDTRIQRLTPDLIETN